jgi:hypothetical protein
MTVVLTTHKLNLSVNTFLVFSVPLFIFLLCAEGFVCAFAHPSCVFAVVTDTPEYFAVLSSARQIGKVRTFFPLLLVHTWIHVVNYFSSFTANGFTLLFTGRHLLVQFVTN